jgi:signal transduction histidine kinase
MQVVTGEDATMAETAYLPATRDSPESLMLQAEAMERAELLPVLEDMPMLILVVNERRQIVWANRRARETARAADLSGLRPGEALGCVHAADMAGGCGTGAICAFCGVSSSIMRSLAGAAEMTECSLQRDDRHGGEAMELLVWTRPIDAGGFRFVLVSAHDRSAQKRHEVLERIFYHDIGNTVGSIRAMLELLCDESGIDTRLHLLHSAAEQLMEEIESQRVLKAAEEGTLAVDKLLVSVGAVIEKAAELFGYALYGKGIRMSVGPSPDEGTPQEDAEVVTDPVILRRVIVNMLKNALEASERGDSIRLGFERRPNEVAIWVWNSSAMSPEAKARVFQRSFTTKGPGRGLGTYGMRLLAERYLGGAVTFDSEAGSGTTFRVLLPKYPSTGPSLTY